MAETAGFFGFDTKLPADSSAWDEDEASRSSNAKNDETFGNWPKLGEIEPRNLVSKLDRMSVNSSSGFPDDPAIMSLQEKPISMSDRSEQMQNMEKIWARPQQLSQSTSLQNMEKIWNQAPAPPSVGVTSSVSATTMNRAPPPGFGPPPGFAPRPEQQQQVAQQVNNVANSMVGANLTGPPAGPAGNIGHSSAVPQMQRGLNVEELERQHFAEGLDALSRRSTLVKDAQSLEAVQVVQAQQIQQPPQGTIGQLHPEHRRALERNKNRNDNRNNRHNQQRRRDPYANLMSRREREWITSMQLRALEIKNPETEDYYYVNYMKRLMQKGNAKNQRELILPAPKENNRNRKRNDSEKESKKEGDEKDEKEKKERKPWSEGSLGKPVSSSVHNPRKMIQIMAKSAEEAVSEDGIEDQNAIEPPKQTNKLKLLKEIEAAFMVLMDLELMVQDELRNFGQEAKKTAEVVSFIKPSEKVRLVSLLSIRKGKRLVQRTLPFLNQEDAAEILVCFFNNLALLIKRDVDDDVLHELYDVLANTINTLDLEKIIEMASRKRHNNLKPIACHSFGASMICKLLDRGQILLSQMSIQEFPADWRQAWLDLVKTLTREIAAVAVKGVLPPLLGVYPALAKALERSASQKHLIGHLNGTQTAAKAAPVFNNQNSFGY